MKLESLKNPKVKEWQKLHEKKTRDEKGLFLVEGNHLMNEALVHKKIVEIISSDENLKIPGIPIYHVTPEILKKLSSQASGTNVISVCKKLEEQNIEGNVCLLDTIQDPGNLGSIIRSAVAFGFKTLILSTDTVDVYNDKVIRASEGMIFNINIIRKDLKEAISKLKEKEYRIYGTDVKNGMNLKETVFPTKVAIIIGNEGKGMREEIKSLCDELVHINILCESLNAAIAASIIFYEVSKNGYNEIK